MGVFIGIYLMLLLPFTDYMRHKPYAEKLGVIPRAEILQVISADQKQFICASIIAKVTMYFGGLMDINQAQISIPPDYPAMSRTIHAALKLDPYNMDGYYFAQAILVWDVRQYRIANDLLEYGMRYRTWDWYLPFFAGFNYAYFLKDYPHAAQMYIRAGELSGNPLFKTLAGRYLQQAGQTEMAISYLKTMEKGARNPAVKKTFQVRLQAFNEVLSIEHAVQNFKADRGKLPAGIDELLSSGYLNRLPRDPYGGTFYLEPDGAVATTSRFAYAGAERSGKLK
jgi:tetratricopeptide (TPR) repeat protein